MSNLVTNPAPACWSLVVVVVVVVAIIAAVVVVAVVVAAVVAVVVVVVVVVVTLVVPAINLFMATLFTREASSVELLTLVLTSAVVVAAIVILSLTHRTAERVNCRFVATRLLVIVGDTLGDRLLQALGRLQPH